VGKLILSQPSKGAKVQHLIVMLGQASVWRLDGTITLRAHSGPQFARSFLCIARSVDLESVITRDSDTRVEMVNRKILLSCFVVGVRC